MPLACSRQISVCSESPDTVQRWHFIFRPSLNHTNSIICMELHTQTCTPHTTLQVCKALRLERCFTVTDFISCLANGGEKLHHNIIIHNRMRRQDGAFQLNALLVSPFKWEKTSSHTDTQHEPFIGCLNQDNIMHLHQGLLRGCLC